MCNEKHERERVLRAATHKWLTFPTVPTEMSLQCVYNACERM